jgi:hypothetical protein
VSSHTCSSPVTTAGRSKACAWRRWRAVPAVTQTSISDCDYRIQKALTQDTVCVVPHLQQPGDHSREVEGMRLEEVEGGPRGHAAQAPHHAHPVVQLLRRAQQRRVLRVQRPVLRPLRTGAQQKGRKPLGMLGMHRCCVVWMRLFHHYLSIRSIPSNAASTASSR